MWPRMEPRWSAFRAHEPSHASLWDWTPPWSRQISGKITCFITQDIDRPVQLWPQNYRCLGHFKDDSKANLKGYLYLFIWEADRKWEWINELMDRWMNEFMFPSTESLFKCLYCPGVGQAEVTSQEPHPDLSCECGWNEHMELSPLPPMFSLARGWNWEQNRIHT